MDLSALPPLPELVIGGTAGGVLVWLGKHVYSIVTGAQQAEDKTKDVYKDLNEALEKQNAAQERALAEQANKHSEEIKAAFEKIKTLEAKVADLEADKSFYDRVFRVALVEYFEKHPEVALAEKRRLGRRATDKVL